MFFASDNTSAILPAVLAALQAENTRAHDKSYGADDAMAQLTAQIRVLFEAPEAEVFLLTTGTAANSLALASFVRPWQGIFCHKTAHISVDECGAPEFFSDGSKLILLEGAAGKIAPEALQNALLRTGESGVHGVQRGALSLTNLTECGTAYSAAEIRALSDQARAYSLPTHLDGARFANALVQSGATPAQMSWRAGVDALSFGATKNGCMGVEAVIFFNTEAARELPLRRKRAGHLLSKNRFLAAQMLGYLADNTWLNAAAHANDMARLLADGLRAKGVRLLYPVDGNMIFADLSAAQNDRLSAAGAYYYQMPAPDGTNAARLVTSWSTRPEEITAFLALL